MTGLGRLARILGPMIVVVLLAPGFNARIGLAAWSAPGSGPAAGAAATMPTGGAPAAAATSGSVTVRWPAVAMSNGTPVAGYLVKRFDATTGAAATVGPGCSGIINTTTCTEQSVPVGTWVYTDTPVQLSWTGGQSPPSPPITV